MPTASSRRAAESKRFSGTGLFAGTPAPTGGAQCLGLRPFCGSGRAREEAGTGHNQAQCCSPARFNSFLHRSDKCTTRKCLPALA
ncbi:MAG TPA: hypothetical protein DDZ74_14810 [Pseudomonas sp.]|uniref:Uncharacterized protein n=1 Tax=Pseudomonas monteilii TaxID=76759 RepID=A0A2N1IS69_9PSED|nr:hypothetical protein CXB65_13080 [Pseudomonas monteilii]RPD92252.1 hypothetical protein EGN69_18920 [Pseudomonas monteilii]TFW19421.1 hypothetical protein E4L40_23895 [Pseudomonas putida]HBK50529.1 hypothetical protein [Pseudomonas sp.]